MPIALVLPGLLAASWSDGSRHAPALARLLAGAGAPRREPDGLAAAIAPLYGVARQHDWPLAPIRLAALGVDPGAAYWLGATPVELVAGRDDVRVGGAIDDLTSADAAALLAPLNDHFARDGLLFIAPRPDAWFVSTAEHPALVTRPLATVLGRPLRPLLPAGADAITWRRWEHEIQMLLHEHPVNAARERSGKPPVTTVWLADGGEYVAPSATPIHTWGGDATVRALASHVGVAATSLPDAPARALADLLAASSEAQLCVVALPEDADARTLDAWAAAASSALDRARVDAVIVVAGGGHAAAVWTARRSPWLRRFTASWRTPTLASLLAATLRD